jgi:tetratricopeptide (TPR) repeat protein
MPRLRSLRARALDESVALHANGAVLRRPLGRCPRVVLAGIAMLAMLAIAPLTGVPVAHAQGAPTDAQRARARQLYGEGQRHFDANRYAEAQTAFEAAFREVPNPVVLLGIASAQERLGRPADAARTLRRYLRERADAPDRASIEERIRALDPTGATAADAMTSAQGRIRISCSPPGASIALDGAATGQAAPAELSVAPGAHVITLTLEGYTPITESITVAPGATVDLALTLASTGGATPTQSEDDVFGSSDATTTTTTTTTTEVAAVDNSPSVGVWVTTAIAGVGLVTGTVFGFLALSAQSDFDAMPTGDAADRGETFALVADLAFGVAIAAGATAIVLYATEQHSAPAAESETSTETAAAAVTTTDAEDAPARTDSVRLSFAPWGGATGGGATLRLEL